MILPVFLQQFVGAMALAAMAKDFPCDTLIKELKRSERPAISVLYSTFGTQTQCLRDFTEAFADRPHLIEIHFSNESCRRMRRCGPGEFYKGKSVSQYNNLVLKKEADSAIARRTAKISRIAESVINSHTTVILSAGLEDAFTEKMARRLARLLRRHWSYSLARNPLNSTGGSRGYDFVEYHGVRPEYRAGNRGVIVANDGFQLSSRGEARMYRRGNADAGVVLLWECATQGRCSDPFTQPRSREFKFTRGLLLRMRAFLRG